MGLCNNSIGIFSTCQLLLVSEYKLCFKLTFTKLFIILLILAKLQVVGSGGHGGHRGQIRQSNMHICHNNQVHNDGTCIYYNAQCRVQPSSAVSGLKWSSPKIITITKSTPFVHAKSLEIATGKGESHRRRRLPAPEIRWCLTA